MYRAVGIRIDARWMKGSSVTDVTDTDGDRAMQTSPTADVADGVDQVLLNEHLPLGVLVIDSLGEIRHVNRRGMALTGYTRDDIVGHSIVEFVEPDDLEFLIASLAFAEHYDDAVMGPSRVRFRHRDGEARWTEYWAYECPASFGFSGYIVTMSPESVTDNLANAAYQIASDEPLATCLTSLARAVTSYPLVATGTMMVRSERLGDTDAIATGGDAAFTLIGHWPRPCSPTCSTGRCRGTTCSSTASSATSTSTTCPSPCAPRLPTPGSDRSGCGR